MAEGTTWETFADLEQDAERAQGLADLRAIVAGSPAWADIVAQLDGLVRDHKARQAVYAPLTPAIDDIGAVFDDIARRYQHRQETGQAVMGHRTGLPTLDTCLDGLDAGRLTVMLAAPGVGKTTISNQLAYEIAAAGAPVLYVSFENSKDDLILKQIARLAGKSARLIRAGSIAPAELHDAWKLFHAGGGPRLYYMAGTATTTADTIRVTVEHLKRMHPGVHPVVMIDFLQRLAMTADAAGRGSGLDDMRGRVGTLAQRLRDMATETGCHIWAISSTNRQAYDTSKATPTLASARESGDVEFAADAVVTIAPASADLRDPSARTESLTVTVVKNRHGEGAKFTVHRDRTSLRIAEESHGERFTTLAGQVRTGWTSA